MIIVTFSAIFHPNCNRSWQYFVPYFVSIICMEFMHHGTKEWVTNCTSTLPWSEHVGFWAVDELQVSWDVSTCKFIHKRCYYKSYHSDITYHMTLNTIFSVVTFMYMVCAPYVVTLLKQLLSSSFFNFLFEPPSCWWDWSVSSMFEHYSRLIS